jgi:hypothetical protein
MLKIAVTSWPACRTGTSVKAEGEPLARVCLGAGDDSRLGGKRVCSCRGDRLIRSKVAVRLYDRSRQRSIMLFEECKKSLLRRLYFHAYSVQSAGCLESWVGSVI